MLDPGTLYRGAGPSGPTKEPTGGLERVTFPSRDARPAPRGALCSASFARQHRFSLGSLEESRMPKKLPPIQGLAVRIGRECLGLTQEEVSQKLGIPRREVSGLE